MIRKGTDQLVFKQQKMGDSDKWYVFLQFKRMRRNLQSINQTIVNFAQFLSFPLPPFYYNLPNFIIIQMKHQPISSDIMHSDIKFTPASQLQLDTISSFTSSSPRPSQLIPLLNFCGYQLFNYGPDIKTFLPCFAMSICVTIAMSVISSYSNMPPAMKYALITINITHNISYLLAALTNPGAVRTNEKERLDEMMVECKKCNIYRGISSSHCSECETCVRGMDHHCPFIGKCVGRYNMPAFVVFMVATAFGLTYNFVFAIGALVMSNQ